MPLSNLLKSAAGTCPFCHRKAGILSREHPEHPEHPEYPEYRRTYQAGWNEMVKARLRRRQVPRVPPEFSPSFPGRNSQALLRRRQYSRTGSERGLERGAQTRCSGREYHSRTGIQTPEVPGPAGTEPEQRPGNGDGTTQPGIQAKALGADPSRRRHCRRRRPHSGTTLKSSPEGRVRVGAILHAGVWHYAGHPDGEAAELQDRRPLVRLQLGSEPSSLSED